MKSRITLSARRTVGYENSMQRKVWQWKTVGNIVDSVRSHCPKKKKSKTKPEKIEKIINKELTHEIHVAEAIGGVADS